MILPKRKFKVKKVNLEIEPQEVLMDALVMKNQEKGSGNYQLEVPLRRKSIIGFWICFVLAMIAIFVRAFQFQIIDHKELAEIAQRNKFISSTVKAQRGVMYDQDMKQIVFNKSTFNLVVDKAKFLKDNTDSDGKINQLAILLNVDTSTIKDAMDEETENEAVVLKNLDYQELLVFESSSDQFSGFKIKNESVRDYKDGFSMSQILGYYRKTGQSTGIENYYNQYLSAKPGELLYERNADGDITAERVVSLPESGKSLVLYMDSGLQSMLYQSLKIKLKDIGATKGAAVAMDPRTGGILAMVSLPTYDNNLFAGDISTKDWERLQNDKNKPMLNRVISGKYPTGSTIKPLMALAGLAENIITPNTTVDCTGKLVVTNPWNKDKPSIFNDWATHGIVDVKKAIAESCNVFFLTVGGGNKNFKGLGVAKIKEYLDKFGWENLTGIDIPGEINGFVPDPDWKQEALGVPWYQGDTYNLSIGQGYLAATPLEVVTSFAAIANGGKLMKPKVVKAIVDENKDIVEEFKPEIIKDNFIDKNDLNIVRQGMREAVTYGGSVTLNSLPVKSASKTGTAEIGKKGYYHNWVTVFAPYDNPEIVITIMAENVQGLHTVTLPVAKEVLNWYFNRNNPAPLVESTSTDNLPTMEE
jgi:penicillin-binding protein 2